MIMCFVDKSQARRNYLGFGRGRGHTVLISRFDVFWFNYFDQLDLTVLMYYDFCILGFYQFLLEFSIGRLNCCSNSGTRLGFGEANLYFIIDI